MQSDSAAVRARAWSPLECSLNKLGETIHVASLHTILILGVGSICCHDKCNHILCVCKVSGGQLRSYEITACSLFLCPTDKSGNVLAAFGDFVNVKFCVHILHTTSVTISWKTNSTIGVHFLFSTAARSAVGSRMHVVAQMCLPVTVKKVRCLIGRSILFQHALISSMIRSSFVA